MYVLHTFVNLAPSIGLADSFAHVLDGVCRAIGVRLSKSPVAVGVMLLLRLRLERLSRRFAAVVARFEAGTLRPPVVRRQTRPRPSDPPLRPPNATRPPGTPSWFGWVIGALPGSEASASSLRALLAEPRTAALLAAGPQAARLLRPLCHMLGIEPSLIPLPPPQALPPVEPEPPRPQAQAITPSGEGRPPAVAAPLRKPARPVSDLA